MKFDGTFLGQYKLNDVVVWAYPAERKTKGNAYPKVFIQLRTQGGVVACIMCKERKFPNYMCIVDEAFGAFGLLKRGTHTISLDHTLTRVDDNTKEWITKEGQSNLGFKPIKKNGSYERYILYRATTEDTPEGTRFINEIPLSSVKWLPDRRNEIHDRHKEFFHELQRVLVVRKMMMVKYTSLSDINVRHVNTAGGEKLVPYSGDCHLTIFEGARTEWEKQKWLGVRERKVLFPKLNTEEQVIKDLMLRGNNMSRDEISEVIRGLKKRLEEIVWRIDNRYCGMIDEIVEKLYAVLLDG